jgi:hypothetical protein
MAKAGVCQEADRKNMVAWLVDITWGWTIACSGHFKVVGSKGMLPPYG